VTTPSNIGITVVTPVFNAGLQISTLIESLLAQTDRNFEWIVADGVSSDNTFDIVFSATDLNPIWISQQDFGIYDALNRALKQATGEYYIVAGADDIFAKDAIENFRAAIIESNADIVVANADHGVNKARLKNAPVWMVGEKAFIANHSLATAFRCSLHKTYGWYSRRFPIAADSLFVLKACKGGASRFNAEFEAGMIGGCGISRTDWAGSATELFRVQLTLGASVLPQTILLLLRIFKGSSPRLRMFYDTIFRQ